MHTRYIRPTHSRRGSTVLEMAIAVPVFLIVGSILLSSIILRKADILFSQATDQVTQETSLLVPIVGAGIDAAEVALDVMNHLTNAQSGEGTSVKAKETATSIIAGISAAFETFDIQPEDQITTLILGKAIRDRIIHVYQSYCDDDFLAAKIRDVGVYIDIDNDNDVIFLRVYYRWDSLFGPVDKEIVSAVPIYGDLSFSLPENEESEKEKNAVWLLGNLERGQKLRQINKANLPFSYPVIAIWSGNTATSIKSIDFTAPEYTNSEGVQQKVKAEIDALAEFTGTPNGFGQSGITIRPEQITDRVLLLIIPENTPEIVYNDLESLRIYAESRGIRIVIQKYGNSYRFVSPPKTPSEEKLTE